jgi:hypothetical protein
MGRFMVFCVQHVSAPKTYVGWKTYVGLVWLALSNSSFAGDRKVFALMVIEDSREDECFHFRPGATNLLFSGASFDIEV